MCPDPYVFWASRIRHYLYASGTREQDPNPSINNPKSKKNWFLLICDFYLKTDNKKIVGKNFNSSTNPVHFLIGTSLLNLNKRDKIILGNPSCELMSI